MRISPPDAKRVWEERPEAVCNLELEHAVEPRDPAATRKEPLFQTAW